MKKYVNVGDTITLDSYGNQIGITGLQKYESKKTRRNYEYYKA